MANLAKLDEVKLYLDLVGTTVHDSFLNLLLSEVSRRVETFCGRTLTRGDYVEKYDITTSEGDRVFLKHYPIHSILALTNDNSSIIVDKSNTDYYLYPKSGMIGYFGGFVKGFQTVEVSYVAGWSVSDVPEDIKGVVCREVGMTFLDWVGGRGGEGVIAEKIGDYSYRKDSGRRGLKSYGFLESSVMILNRYKEYRTSS